MPKTVRCPNCKSREIVFVEYDYDIPEHIDGWSEMLCKSCQTRVGRWSQKVLTDNEREKRYGKE